MINLLPPAEKERLSLEMGRKISIIVWMLFLFFIIYLILILLSIKFYLQGQIEYQKIIIQKTESALQKTQTRELLKKIDNFNGIFEKLNSFYGKKIYFSKILEKISKIMPSGAYLTEVRLNSVESAEEGGVIEASLSGFILTREMLFDFKKVLEKEQSIKDVSFPPSNWVNPVNINFFVSFKMPQGGQ